MKKVMLVASYICLTLAFFALVGCGSQVSSSGDSGDEASNNTQTETETKTDPVTIKGSPDKYTWYVKDYYGLNAAACGYTSLSEDRYDRYGAAAIQLRFITVDGTHVDPKNEDDLKQYVVCCQNTPPNTEIKIEFDKDSEGEEYDNLTSFVSIQEILLGVKEVGSADVDIPFTEIPSSADKHTASVRDYVGRNLADCGYLALDGQLHDRYNAATVKLNIVASDGAFVDPGDEEQLKQYKVVSQSVAPCEAITMVYQKDDDGNEYSNLVSEQNIQSIDLRVERVE